MIFFVEEGILRRLVKKKLSLKRSLAQKPARVYLRTSPLLGKKRILFAGEPRESRFGQRGNDLFCRGRYFTSIGQKKTKPETLLGSKTCPCIPPHQPPIRQKTYSFCGRASGKQIRPARQ